MSNSDFVAGAISLPLIALLMVLALPFAIYQGWVLTYLWQWFAVPLHAPALSVHQAAGIMYLIAFLRANKTARKDEKTDWPTTLGVAFLGPIFTLGAGYVLYLWVR